MITEVFYGPDRTVYQITLFQVEGQFFYVINFRDAKEEKSLWQVLEISKLNPCPQHTWALAKAEIDGYIELETQDVHH